MRAAIERGRPGLKALASEIRARLCGGGVRPISHPMMTDDEVLAYIERRRLMGLGIGYIDVHLLAAAALTPSARLWTRDKRLARVAADVGVGIS